MTRPRRSLLTAPITVSDVMAWLNGLFGGRIPVLPLPSSWAASLTQLWSALVDGPLPPPTSPKPWAIVVEGSWRPFTWCDATFTGITIVVRDASTQSATPPQDSLWRTP